MSSLPVSDLATALNGNNFIDRSPLELRLYTPSQAKALNNEQLNTIMIPHTPNANSENVWCREFECTFTSTLQSNKRYFKRENLVKQAL